MSILPIIEFPQKQASAKVTDLDLVRQKIAEEQFIRQHLMKRCITATVNEYLHGIDTALRMRESGYSVEQALQEGQKIIEDLQVNRAFGQ